MLFLFCQIVQTSDQECNTANVKLFSINQIAYIFTLPIIGSKKLVWLYYIILLANSNH